MSVDNSSDNCTDADWQRSSDCLSLADTLENSNIANQSERKVPVASKQLEQQDENTKDEHLAPSSSGVIPFIGKLAVAAVGIWYQGTDAGCLQPYALERLKKGIGPKSPQTHISATGNANTGSESPPTNTSATGNADTEQYFTSQRIPKKSNAITLLHTPWRPVSWNKKTCDDLIAAVQNCDILSIPSALLIGPVGAGKSSFINSIMSLDKKEIVHKTAAWGASQASVTKRFKKYRGRNILTNFRLCDTMGIEAETNKGFNVNDLDTIIDGHVKVNHRFHSTQPLTPYDEDYRQHAKEEDKCHMVLIVLDSQMLATESMTKAFKDKIMELLYKMNDKGIPRAIVLTKIDKLCEDVASDITNTFKSVKIQKAVQVAHEYFGVPRSHIHPIKNYEVELVLDPLINIPLLLVLRQLINNAAAYQEDDDYDTMAETA